MAIKILSDYQAHLTNLDTTRTRMDALYSVHQVTSADIDAIYESLFLKAVIGFERFSEQLFFGILKREIKHYDRSGLMAGIRFPPGDSIRRFLLAAQRQRYFTWIPIKDAVSRAHIYLKDGMPFAKLVKADKDILDTIVVIRNAIAHESPHAMAEFGKVLQANKYSQPERTPAGFLRYQFRTNPAQNHLQGYIASLGAIATKLG